MAVITVRTRVNFFDTDAMAVVHHANYLRWFEMGRVEFLRAAGITLNDLMAEGYVFPITEASCQYRVSARFDDMILIETTPTALTPVKMKFHYRVLREADGALLAEGMTQNVFTRLDTGKITKLPPAYYEKLRAMRETDKESLG